jgi:hypothetical protein
LEIGFEIIWMFLAVRLEVLRNCYFVTVCCWELLEYCTLLCRKLTIYGWLAVFMMLVHEWCQSAANHWRASPHSFHLRFIFSLIFVDFTIFESK